MNKINFDLNVYGFKNIISFVLAVIIFALPFMGKPKDNHMVFFAQIAIIIVAVVWLVYKIIRREGFGFNTALIIPALILVIAYVIPVLFNNTEKYNQIIRYCGLFSIFIMFVDLSKDNKNINLFLKAVGISGVIASFLSIDASLGGLVTNALGFTQIHFDGYRTAGILGHPSSSAIFFILGIFALILISIISENRLSKVIYSGLIAPVVIGLCLTMTPSSMIIFLICYLALLLTLNSKADKAEYVISSLISLISGLIFFVAVTKVSLEMHAVTQTYEELLVSRNAGTIYTAVSVALPACSTFILLKQKDKLLQIAAKTYIKITALALAVVAVIATVIFPTGLYKYFVPEVLVRHFSVAVPVQQGSPMSNFVINLWKNTGFLGILAITFFIVLSIFIAFKSIKSKEPNAVLMTSVIMGFVLFLDFLIGSGMSLGYFVLAVILFALMGIIDSRTVK